jgi:hypothetical protein
VDTQNWRVERNQIIKRSVSPHSRPLNIEKTKQLNDKYISESKSSQLKTDKKPALKKRIGYKFLN